MFWAHSANDLGQWDPLPRHLRAVADLAHTFGEPLGLAQEAYWAGLLHDLGKYDTDFQRRLQDPTISAAHAAYGSCIAGDSKSFEVAFAVAAHHAGLSDRSVLKDLPGRRPTRHPNGPTFQQRASELRAMALADLPELGPEVLNDVHRVPRRGVICWSAWFASFQIWGRGQRPRQPGVG